MAKNNVSDGYTGYPPIDTELDEQLIRDLRKLITANSAEQDCDYCSGYPCQPKCGYKEARKWVVASADIRLGEKK